MYGRGGAAIAHGVTTSPNYPFAWMTWSGSCDAGQLSSGGLLLSQAGAFVPRRTTTLHGPASTRKKTVSMGLYHDRLNAVGSAKI
jgi:hypothetical protein